MEKNMSFNAAAFKGSGKVNGVPVFTDKLPLTVGGIVSDASTEGLTFGRVAYRDADNLDYFVQGKGDSNTVVAGIALADPSIMMLDPAMNNYYFSGRPATVVTHGLVQLSDVLSSTDDSSLSEAAYGSKVVFNTTTGKIGFVASTGTVAEGYAELDAYVYDITGPNGVTIFLNKPAVVA